MPTISAGNTAEFYCPLASSVTFTPGSGGTMKLGFAVASGSAAIAPQTIGAATSITVSAGATVFAQAVGVDATYTAPAGVDTALQALVSNAGNGAALVNSTGYHFAGIPGDHINTATKWYDRSGMGNDAAFQASISAAAAWANPGYCTIPDPVGTTALMAIPALNFDYAAGQSLFIFWRGLATPEGTDYPIMGDSGQNSATFANGVALICKTTGKVHIRAYDAAGNASAGGDSTTTVFSATVENSFAICLDGVTRTYCYWANGVRESAFASNFLSFASGASIDTISGRSFKLGGSDIVTASTQWGVLQKVRQLHILRRAAGLGVPAGIDAMVLNLHKNPQRLVTAAEW